MARPPSKSTKPPEVEFYRHAPITVPSAVPTSPRASSVPPAALPPVRAETPAAKTYPPPRLGPWLPRPNLFPRPAPVERASLPPFGQPVDLPMLDAVEDAQLPDAIARALEETAPAARELIRRIGHARGAAFLHARYAKTRAIEAAGGLRLPTYDRRRTPGGTFFVQCRARMTPEAFEDLSSLALLTVGLLPTPPSAED